MSVTDVAVEAGRTPELLLVSDHAAWVDAFVDAALVDELTSRWQTLTRSGQLPDGLASLADDANTLAAVRPSHIAAVRTVHAHMQRDERYRAVYGSYGVSAVEADLFGRVQQADRHARMNLLLPIHLQSADAGKFNKGDFDAMLAGFQPSERHRIRLLDRTLPEFSGYLADTNHLGWRRDASVSAYAHILKGLDVADTPQSTLTALVKATESMATKLARGDRVMDEDVEQAHSLMTQLANRITQLSQSQNPAMLRAIMQTQKIVRERLGTLVERRCVPDTEESARKVIGALHLKPVPKTEKIVQPGIVVDTNPGGAASIGVFASSPDSIVVRPGLRTTIRSATAFLGLVSGTTAVFGGTAAADTGHGYDAAHRDTGTGSIIVANGNEISSPAAFSWQPVATKKALITTPEATTGDSAPHVPESTNNPAALTQTDAETSLSSPKAIDQTPTSAVYTAVTLPSVTQPQPAVITAAKPLSTTSSEMLPMTPAVNPAAQEQITHDEFGGYIKGQNVELDGVIQRFDKLIQQVYAGDSLVAADTPDYLAAYQKQAGDLLAAIQDPANGLTADQRAQAIMHIANGWAIIKYPALLADSTFTATLTPAGAAPELAIYVNSIKANYTSPQIGVLGNNEGVQIPTMDAAITQLGYADATMNTPDTRLAALQLLDPDAYTESVLATKKFVAAQRAAAAKLAARTAAAAKAEAAKETAAIQRIQHQQPEIASGQPLSSQQVALKAAEALSRLGGDWTSRGIAMKYMIAKFQSLGFTNAGIAAAGFGGNTVVESGTNPQRVQDGFDGGPYSSTIPDSIKGGKGGYGLDMWTSTGRLNGLQEFADNDPQKRGVDDMSLQLDYRWDQLTSSYPGVVDRLRQATTPEQAASIVMGHNGDGYENPGTPHEDVRRQAARDIYNQFNRLSNEIRAASRPKPRVVTHHPLAARGETKISSQKQALIQTAVRFSKTTTNFNDHVPDPDYLKARRAMNPGGPDDPWNEADTDCSIFIKTTVRASGVDPNWTGNSGGAIRYAQQSQQWTVYTNAASTPGGVQPGDILANNGHIFMYVGPQANGNSVAEASWDEGNGGHVPEIDSALYTSQDHKAFQVIRYTG